MATAIGDLVVNLRADNKKFNSGMSAAQSALTKLTAAAVLTAGALAIVVKRSLSSIDEMAKLSARVGVSTEFLKSMGFAAEQTGASQEILNKAISDFSKRIGQAQQGLSTQKRALESLGLTSKQVSEIPLEKAFALVASRLGSLESQTLKTAVASDLFGRSGVKLINMFQEGGSGLSDFTREAERLGITFSNFDAAKVEEANDAMNRVKQVIGGAADSLTIALAPAIESAATTLVPLIAAAGRFAVGLARWSTTIITTVSVLVGLKAGMMALVLAQKAYAAGAIIVQALSGPAGWVALAAGVAIATAAIADINVRFNDITSGARKSQAALVALDETNKAMAGGVRDALSPAFAESTSLVLRFGERIRDLRSFGGMAVAQLLEVREADKFIVEFTESLRKLDAARQAVDPINALKNALGDLSEFAELLGGDSGVIGSLGSVIKDEIGKLSGVTDQIEKARLELEKLSGIKTDIDIAVEGALSRGALPEQAAALRELLEKAQKIRDKTRIGEDKDREFESEQERLRGLADSIFEQTRTPAERLAAELEKMIELWDEGFLSTDTFQRAIAQAKSRAAGPKEAAVAPKLNQGLVKGSKEAFDKVLKFSLGGKKDSDQKKQTVAAVDSEKHLAEIAETLADGDIVVGAFS